jgi:hypothetical protein
MADCKSASTPTGVGLKLLATSNSKSANELMYRSAGGKLDYLTTTALDLRFVIGHASRFKIAPGANHWTSTKRILRNVKITLDSRVWHSVW